MTMNKQGKTSYLLEGGGGGGDGGDHSGAGEVLRFDQIIQYSI